MNDDLVKPKGDKEKIEAFTDYLWKQFVEYTQEHETTLIDALLVGHSLHKIVVMEIAAKWELEGHRAERTIRMSDQTWRLAMKDLKNRLPMVKPLPSKTSRQ